MNLSYRVELSQAERDELKALIGAGKHPVPLHRGFDGLKPASK
jgi:hypothetical protein